MNEQERYEKTKKLLGRDPKKKDEPFETLIGWDEPKSRKGK